LPRWPAAIRRAMLEISKRDADRASRLALITV
jgi:hypothetical protein